MAGNVWRLLTDCWARIQLSISRRSFHYHYLGTFIACKSYVDSFRAGILCKSANKPMLSLWLVPVESSIRSTRYTAALRITIIKNNLTPHEQIQRNIISFTVIHRRIPLSSVSLFSAFFQRPRANLITRFTSAAYPIRSAPLAAGHFFFCLTWASIPENEQ